MALSTQLARMCAASRGHDLTTTTTDRPDASERRARGAERGERGAKQRRVRRVGDGDEARVAERDEAALRGANVCGATTGGRPFLSGGDARDTPVVRAAGGLRHRRLERRVPLSRWWRTHSPTQHVDMPSVSAGNKSPPEPLTRRALFGGSRSSGE